MQKEIKVYHLNHTKRENPIKWKPEKISCVLITRNRPHNLIRLFNSILATTTDMVNFELSIRLDDNDTVSMPVLKKYQKRIPMIISYGKRTKSTFPIWNAAWKQATGEIYMMLGDDIIFRTKDWDTIVRKEFLKYPDKIVFIYGRDGHLDDKLGTHGFLHKNYCDTVGYFTNPALNIYFGDNTTDDVTRRLKRNVYLSSIFFEHMHYTYGKSPVDKVYKELAKRSQGDYDLYVKTRKEPQLAICHKLMKKFPSIGKFTDDDLELNLTMANPAVPYPLTISFPRTDYHPFLKGVTMVIVDDVDFERVDFALSHSLKEATPEKVLYIGSLKQDKYPQVNVRIPSLAYYSRFMMNHLHRYINTPFCLVMQWDGFILNGSVWDNNWLGYDYIGAPWQQAKHRIGNGGFSLRSHKFLKAGASLHCNQPIAEDMVLCDLRYDDMIKKGIKFAPFNVAIKFSIESWYRTSQRVNLGWDGQFGFHDHEITNIDKSGVIIPWKKNKVFNKTP